MEAGEEVATTNAIVDVLGSFGETELTVIEFLSDFLDVDVTLDSLMDEEVIEVIGPVFQKQVCVMTSQSGEVFF